MGTIGIELFTTLDLVAQAPGGPEEDAAGFEFGGWQVPFVAEIPDEWTASAYDGTDALLLGRRTYDVFAAFWPQYADDEAFEVARLFNTIPKYVASRGHPNLGWAGSVRLGPDLPAAVRELRAKHAKVTVVGSLDLVQTLLRERLFDVLTLYVHPIVLGSGKTVFDGGAVPANLTLLRPPEASPGGTVRLQYRLADGFPATGDMAALSGDA